MSDDPQIPGGQIAGGNVTPLRPTRPCAICSKKSQPAFHPFCSKHCADVDLNRWLKGAYVIPAAQEPEDWSEDTGTRQSEQGGEAPD